MKLSDMDTSFITGFTLTCVSAVIAGLIPAVRGEETLQTIERAPANLFETERENALAKFLDFGPISVRPHLYADTYYDNNISLRERSEREDWVWRIFPGVLFGAGEFRGDKGTYLSLDYTMGGKIYTKYDEFNSLDHDVIASGGWKLAKLTLGLSQSYTIENGKQVEVGTIVEQESYITLLTSRYDVSDKTWLELNGRQALISTEDQEVNAPLNDVNEWAAELWGNYRATEKVSTGLGATVGWRDVRSPTGPSPNQTFEQFLARGTYHLSEKVDLMGSAGLQLSQFENGDDKGPNFVFTLGGSWRALENTYASLEAYRRDVPSYVYNGRNYDLTGIRAAVKQLFREKYSASLSTGYEYSDYTDTGSGAPSPDRQDHYFWIRPGVDYTINDRWVMGLFYQYRTKDSSESGFDYSNHQIGLFSNYRF